MAAEDMVTSGSEREEVGKTAMEVAFAAAKPLKPKKNRELPASPSSSLVGLPEGEPLIQIETTPGLAWEAPKEAPPPGRARRLPLDGVSTDSPIQVETKIPIGEATELSLPVLDTVVGPEARIQESSFESVKALLAQELEEEGKIERLTLTRVPEGLQLHAELDAGLLDGRAVVDGTIISSGNWIHIEGLDVKGRERMKRKITNALFFFEDAIEDHFKKQYAGTVEGIAIGETNLQIKLAAEEASRVPPGQMLLSSDLEPMEATPKEWRDKLRTLITEAKEKISGSEWHAFLTRRSEDLDREAATLGVTETKFRQLGEWYAKRGWKTKLAVGVSLGVGAGVFSTVSMPLAVACLSGIAAQRTAGLASSFLKFEKRSKDIAWGKERAMGKAIVYSVAMTGAMLLLTEGVKEGFHYVEEHDWSEAMPQWLKQHWPSANGAKADQTVDVAAPRIPDMSTIDVQATPGHGAEYMMKQLWEQMQSRHMTLPSGTDAHSDLARLLNAKPDEIDSVVHLIAADPKHGFFSSVGTSVRVDLNAHMTIGTDGQIRLNGALHIPESAPMTPPHLPSDGVSGIRETVTPDTFVPEAPFTSIDMPASSQSEHHIPIVEPSHVSPAPLNTPRHEIGSLEDSSGHVVDDSEGTPVHLESPDHIPDMNAFGVPVPANEPHLYMGEDKTLFVYGGSNEDQANLVKGYLSQHPGKVICGGSANGYRALWVRDLAGNLIQGPPIRSKGLFGLASSFLSAPAPDEFKMRIT